MARMNVLADVVKGLRANIHAVDNLSPVSRVAVYVKAGSRYEPDAVPGISHYIRASAGLTTQESSIFGITRHMERAGASFKVTSDREYIIYRVDCLRDKLGYVLKFIDDTIHKPEYRAWELVDIVKPRLKNELAKLKSNQQQVVNEATHKAAFRGGLAHSVYTPEHQIEKITKEDLFEYFEKNYVLERMSFFGLGVDEGDLKNTIEDNFKLNGSPYRGVNGETRYVGGEARIQAGFPHTMVNYVVKGCAIGDMTGIAALELLSSLLGGSQQKYIKYGDGPQHSLSAALNPISNLFKSSIVNINHTDTGLFGFSLVGPNQHLNQATKQAVTHVKTVLSGLSENDLKAAKRAAKARALIECENQDAVFNNIGRLHAAGIVGKSPLDILDQVTLKDVQTVASQLLKSKPTLVSVGNPRYVPYVDEIDS